MLKRFILILPVVLLSGSALGQAGHEAPPPIQFESWQEMEGVEGAKAYRVQFPSALSTDVPENNVVPVTVYLPEESEKPVPAVVLLHYLGASDLRVEQAIAQDLVRRGVGALILELPYHLTRTPPGARSGSLAITSDPEKVVSTLIQSVLDVRRAIDFVRSRPEFNPEAIGVSGTSLGSIVAALTYALDDRLVSGAFILGGVDIAHIFWHSSRVVKQREEMRGKGMTEEKLRAALTNVEPLSFLPSRKAGDAYVIGAKFDTVIPPADTQKLIDALPGAEKLWLDTGHYGGVFVQKRIQRSVAEFFEARFAGREFKAPRRVYAPTLRVGAIAVSNTGFQIAAGVDLIKFDSRGNALTTLFATPRGLQVFVGVKLDKNVFIGGFGSQQGFGFGASWSTVL